MSKPSYSYICVPVTDMRADSHLNAEVISQAFFSEAIRVEEEEGDWVYVYTLGDKYRGWIKKTAIHHRDTPYPNNPVAMVNRLAAHLYTTADTIYGPLFTLPYESKLEIIDPNVNSSDRWLKVALPNKQIGYIQRGDVIPNPPLLTCDQMSQLSLFFLGLPYTWGGRSSFGYDCSGFVQMLYRQCGIHLPRDAKDQCSFSDFENIELNALSPGDLIFFGYAQNKIRHVGLSLGDNKFIHAVATAENAPYIRISHLTDGAWNGSGHYPYRIARAFPNYS